MTNLQLIDWWEVGFGALIVLGLALDLSVVGWVYYQAGEKRVSLRQEWRSGGYGSVGAIGLVLFCAGMAGTASAAWERIAWGVLLLAFAFQGWQGARSRHEPPDESDQGSPTSGP